MMPYRTPQEEAERSALLKRAVTIVFVAVNSCGDAVTTEAICKLIDMQCNSPVLRNMAYTMLAATLAGLARAKAQRTGVTA